MPHTPETSFNVEGDERPEALRTYLPGIVRRMGGGGKGENLYLIGGHGDHWTDDEAKVVDETGRRFGLIRYNRYGPGRSQIAVYDEGDGEYGYNDQTAVPTETVHESFLKRAGCPVEGEVLPTPANKRRDQEQAIQGPLPGERAAPPPPTKDDLLERFRGALEERSAHPEGRKTVDQIISDLEDSGVISSGQYLGNRLVHDVYTGTKDEERAAVEETIRAELDENGHGDVEAISLNEYYEDPGGEPDGLNDWGDEDDHFASIAERVAREYGLLLTDPGVGTTRGGIMYLVHSHGDEPLTRDMKNDIERFVERYDYPGVEVYDARSNWQAHADRRDYDEGGSHGREERPLEEGEAWEDEYEGEGEVDLDLGGAPSAPKPLDLSEGDLDSIRDSLRPPSQDAALPQSMEYRGPPQPPAYRERRGRGGQEFRR